MTDVRQEEPGDIPGIHQVYEAVPDMSAEADLVDALRDDGAHVVSLVAVEHGRVVGHILFTPVEIETAADGVAALGLAPLAVRPDCQGRGIGSRLVEAGLAACAAQGAAAVVVLGYPRLYTRFGFAPAHGFGLACEFDAPLDAFMAKELCPGALAGCGGVARFHPAFGRL